MEVSRRDVAQNKDYSPHETVRDEPSLAFFSLLLIWFSIMLDPPSTDFYTGN